MKNQKKQIIISCIIGVLTLVPALSIAQDISRLYVNMPKLISPVISQKQRFELLEYAKSGLGDSIRNRFDNQTYISELDTVNNYIRVKNTESSTFEMFIFKNNSDTVIGIIKTVCSPICQSQIEFYDLRWKKYPLKFDMPKASDWVTTDINTPENNDIPYILSVSFISLSYNPSSGEIIAKNNSLKYIDIQEQEKIENRMKYENFIYIFRNGIWSKKEINRAKDQEPKAKIFLM